MPYQRIKRVCPQCKKERKFPKDAKFCSKKCYLDSVTVQPVVLANEQQTPEFLNYDSAVARFRFLIGAIRKSPSPPTLHTSRDKVTAVFSDPHCPHFDEDFTAWAIADAKRRGATRAVVPGDLQDLFSFSRFAKYEHVALKDELASARLFTQMLSENFAEVDIIPGNHDDRSKKHFARLVQSEFFFLIKWNLLEIVTDGLVNVRLPKLTAQGRDIPWLWNDGDLVLGHPESSSKVLMKPVDTFANWLTEWRDVLGLPKIRVVGQGHTHFAGGPAVRHDGIAVFELGCMCRLPDYVFDAKLKYHPQTNAYAIFVQRDGRTDLNDSRLFFRP